MNRIQHLVEDDPTTTFSPPLAIDLAGRPDSEPQDAHCIITPLHYERNYAYPLIVWLHGPDDDERQVTRVMPHVSTRNYAAVGPRGTVAVEHVAGGYTWSQQSEHVAQAERRVLAAISAARSWLNIAPQRVYLAGFGAGGTMAFRIALAQPQMFAGVASFGGALPTTMCPMVRLPSIRRLRAFIANGLESRQYPEVEVCRDLRLFHAAGLSLCLRLYPCGDDLLTNMLSDMDRWIMHALADHEQPRENAAQQRSPRR